MKWPILAVVAFGITATGCDRLSSLPFIGGGDDEAVAEDTAQAPMTEDTTALAGSETLDTTALMPEPEPEIEPAYEPRGQAGYQMMVDEPWFPIDTGTVRPGMTRIEVVAVWGEPVTERMSANRTYMYYRNGCEVTCGTFDVVFLEGDQVVDAIVRGPGHTYAGMSSSPPEREAEFTPPGTEGGGAGVN
jgi:hypothetical protein